MECWRRETVCLSNCSVNWWVRRALVVVEGRTPTQCIGCVVCSIVSFSSAAVTALRKCFVVRRGRCLLFASSHHISSFAPGYIIHHKVGTTARETGQRQPTPGTPMATCKRRSKEDVWASGLRQISSVEMTVRRYIGYICFFLALGIAHWKKGQWSIETYEGTTTPTFNTLLQSGTLASLSGAAVMLYAMGELSQ